MNETFCPERKRLLPVPIPTQKSSSNRTLTGFVITKSGSAFQLFKKLAEGGLGTVYLARRTHDQQLAALKLPSKDNDTCADKLLKREAFILQRLNHPNIVKVVEAGETIGGESYLALEYLDGPTLEQSLHKYGCLTAPRAIHLFSQISSALAHAHASGIAHGDIKPANIVVCHRNGEATAVVIDFGVSWTKNNAPFSGTDTVYLSLQYMSPEQMVGQHCTPKTDLYQLGLVLEESLTGKLPFGLSQEKILAYRCYGEIIPKLLRGILEDVEPKLVSLLTQALARDPDDRQADMNVFSEQLMSLGAQASCPMPFT